VIVWSSTWGVPASVEQSLVAFEPAGIVPVQVTVDVAPAAGTTAVCDGGDDACVVEAPPSTAATAIDAIARTYRDPRRITKSPRFVFNPPTARGMPWKRASETLLTNYERLA
jgi:hypothetical protein